MGGGAPKADNCKSLEPCTVALHLQILSSSPGACLTQKRSNQCRRHNRKKITVSTEWQVFCGPSGIMRHHWTEWDTCMCTWLSYCLCFSQPLQIMCLFLVSYEDLPRLLRVFSCHYFPRFRVMQRDYVATNLYSNFFFFLDLFEVPFCLKCCTKTSVCILFRLMHSGYHTCHLLWHLRNLYSAIYVLRMLQNKRKRWR
jgi:hypothetical protein